MGLTMQAPQRQIMTGSVGAARCVQDERQRQVQVVVGQALIAFVMEVVAAAVSAQVGSEAEE